MTISSVKDATNGFAHDATEVGRKNLVLIWRSDLNGSTENVHGKHGTQASSSLFALKDFAAIAKKRKTSLRFRFRSNWRSKDQCCASTISANP